MKCPNCGKHIGIEVPKCPACGHTNPLAKKHNENIKKYDKRFKKTQDNVLTSAQKTEGVGIRGGIFAILVAVIVILAFVWGFVIAASEGETDEDRERDALKNKTKYSAQMRDFLEEGDYITFESFLLQHNIPLNSEPYKEFQRLEYVANRYYTCVQLWEKIILRSDDPDYWDSSETDISNLCMYLDSFMEVYEYNVKVEKNEDIAAYIEDMNSDIRAMLRRYLQMTDDEVDEFLGYSQAKKAVAMEEILLREVPEDE